MKVKFVATATKDGHRTPTHSFVDGQIKEVSDVEAQRLMTGWPNNFVAPTEDELNPPPVVETEDAGEETHEAEHESSEAGAGSPESSEAVEGQAPPVTDAAEQSAPSSDDSEADTQESERTPRRNRSHGRR